MLHRIAVKTTDTQSFINITRDVASAVTQSGVQDGIAVIYCPHTTAGITVNENADPDVVADMCKGLQHAFPDLPQYRHFEGNSTAHVKSSTIGASQTFIISGGSLLLGTWQGIYFCEFDGPRSRTVYVKVLEG